MRHLMLLTFAVAFLPGCASSSTPSTASARPATQTVVGGSAGSMTIANSTSSNVSRLAYAPDAVWRILPSVFDSVGITVNTIDPARKTIGNAQYKIRQRLGKSPLSRYLDCGSSQIGPNADSYDVLLTVLSTVAPEGASGATLTTVVEAQAKPVTYSQGYLRCSSRGGIEKSIADLVNARLSR